MVTAGLALTGLDWITLTGATTTEDTRGWLGSWWSDRSILLPRLGRGGSQVVRWLYVASKLSPRHFQLQGDSRHTWSAPQHRVL